MRGMKTLTVDLIKQHYFRAPGEAINKCLYNAITKCILEGILKSHVRIPSSRDLSAELKLSRNSVLRVYEQLQAEGYIISSQGSGTYVAEHVEERCSPGNKKLRTTPVLETQPVLSERSLKLLSQASANSRQWGYFLPGVPDIEIFPHRAFNKLLMKNNRYPEPEQLTYDTTGGHIRLKRALTEYLSISRGVICEPQQILITEGSHQALDLITRSLCDEDDRAWVEEPGYWGIKNILNINGVKIRAFDVDGCGFRIPVHSEAAPKIIYVTPSHQYPLGSVMSLTRRRQLLSYAKANDAWIVEDDYDSEFRYAGSPIPSLQGLENNSRVIYVGTFSKTMYPGIRVGYVVFPQVLAEDLIKIHNEIYRSGHLKIQESLADFLEEGFYSSHIRKMRIIYNRRRTLLKSMIIEKLGYNSIVPYEMHAGLHLVILLPSGISDIHVAEKANQEELLVRPLSRYYLNPAKKMGLILGYANVPDEKIEFLLDKLIVIIKAFTRR